MIVIQRNKGIYAMITYNGDSVLLEGKKVGEIRKVTGGYQYWPEGKKKLANKNDVFSTVAEVRKVLEAE